MQILVHYILRDSGYNSGCYDMKQKVFWQIIHNHTLIFMVNHLTIQGGIYDWTIFLLPDLPLGIAMFGMKTIRMTIIELYLSVAADLV